jgi:hypothetical protein
MNRDLKPTPPEGKGAIYNNRDGTHEYIPYVAYVSVNGVNEEVLSEHDQIKMLERENARLRADLAKLREDATAAVKNLDYHLHGDHDNLGNMEPDEILDALRAALDETEVPE